MKLDDARQIAIRELKGNVRDCEWGSGRGRLVFAGSWKFEECWARDFAFAVPALLLAGETAAVADTLRAFYATQRDDGLFPRKISSMGNFERNLRVCLKRSGISLRPGKRVRPEYRTAGMIGREPKDVNPLILLATAQASFGADSPRVENAFSYLERHMKDGLVFQHHYEDWADHSRREGYVLYTNVLYLKALGAFSHLPRMHRRIAETRKALARFWRGDRFADAIGGGTHNTPFAFDGNMLLLETGFATGKQERLIAGHAAAAYEQKGYIPIVYPSYAPGMMSLSRRMFLAPYNDGNLLLPWIQCLAARALARSEPGLARALIEDIARVICRLGRCPEALVDGKDEISYPLTSPERHFTWTAASYIETHDFLKGKGVL